MALGGQLRWDRQDHDQAGGDAVGAVQRAATSQGQPTGQVGLAYTLGGRILAAASWGRLVCGSSNGPRGYVVLRHPIPRALRAEPLVTRLGHFV
jgi:hypothetical protein